jgi:hypothetical protein
MRTYHNRDFKTDLLDNARTQLQQAQDELTTARVKSTTLRPSCTRGMSSSRRVRLRPQSCRMRWSTYRSWFPRSQRSPKCMRRTPRRLRACLVRRTTRLSMLWGYQGSCEFVIALVCSSFELIALVARVSSSPRGCDDRWWSPRPFVLWMY